MSLAVAASFVAGVASVTAVVLAVKYHSAKAALAAVRAEVTKVEGRRLEFVVRAFDDVEQIGSGSHRRAVIDAAKFNDRLKTKQKH